jgi:hypothetical protein
MTKPTTVSVKIPARILEKIPAPGNGRSRFIVNAIEEKIARRKPASGKPKTARGGAWPSCSIRDEPNACHCYPTNKLNKIWLNAGDGAFEDLINLTGFLPGTCRFVWS